MRGGGIASGIGGMACGLGASSFNAMSVGSSIGGTNGITGNLSNEYEDQHLLKKPLDRCQSNPLSAMLQVFSFFSAFFTIYLYNYPPFDKHLYGKLNLILIII